jgi:hypothetical protein
VPADIPDVLCPLIVWKAALAAAERDGRERFGDRYVLLRLDDLRADPGNELERIYGLDGRTPPPGVVEWATANIRRKAPIHLADDPRWAKAARLLGMESELERAGYADILDLDPDPDTPLDLTPPPRRSRLAGLMGRARRASRAGGSRARSDSPDRSLD